VGQVIGGKQERHCARSNKNDQQEQADGCPGEYLSHRHLDAREIPPKQPSADENVKSKFTSCAPIRFS
jgi:hypothetical protein